MGVAHLRAPSGVDGHQGTDAVTVTRGPLQFNGDPAATRSDVIAQQRGAGVIRAVWKIAGVVVDHQVEIAIIVEVSGNHAAGVAYLIGAERPADAGKLECAGGVVAVAEDQRRVGIDPRQRPIQRGRVAFGCEPDGVRRVQLLVKGVELDIRRVAESKLATRVKVADILANLGDNPGNRQIVKFAKALIVLCRAGH